MKIHRVETQVELDYFIEKDAIGVSIPHYVHRMEYPDKIVWLGLETNWKFENGTWFRLEKSNFVPCDTPEYELKYQKITTCDDSPS
jgi:hypothetical protein